MPKNKYRFGIAASEDEAELKLGSPEALTAGWRQAPKANEAPDAQSVSFDESIDGRTVCRFVRGGEWSVRTSKYLTDFCVDNLV